MKTTIVAKDKEHLIELLQKEFLSNGYDANLNFIDVSYIRDMKGLFAKTGFIGDISQWNVSNVDNMDYMFYDAKFNGDVSNWQLDNLKSTRHMFEFSEFNNDINHWNVEHIVNMEYMFASSHFSYELKNWKPYLADISKMFENSNAPHPLWTKYENPEERTIYLNHYLLDNMLSKKDSGQNKYKI